MIRTDTPSPGHDSSCPRSSPADAEIRATSIRTDGASTCASISASRALIKMLRSACSSMVGSPTTTTGSSQNVALSSILRSKARRQIAIVRSTSSRMSSGRRGVGRARPAKVVSWRTSSAARSAAPCAASSNSLVSTLALAMARSRFGTIPIRRLLKLCAMPAESCPMASSFWLCRWRSSASRRSVMSRQPPMSFVKFPSVPRVTAPLARRYRCVPSGRTMRCSESE